jgi:TonB family protein
MFADDYHKKGTFGSYTFSAVVHILILLLILMYQQKKNKALADYTLTEITMIQEIPDEQKQVKIEPPKKMFDFLKQVIPIKQKAQIELSKPQDIKLDKPKMEMSKPQALALDKTKLDMKPAMKALDLDNEIGKKSISPAQMQAQLALQKQQQMAAAPSAKLNMSNKAPSGFLPMAGKPVISTDASRSTGALKQSAFKLGQPTPEPKQKSLAEENINIPQKKALLITGDIAGRQILSAKKPSYPRWLQDQGAEASVTLFFTVSPDGSVKDNLMVERTSGYTELDDLAKEALLQFKFATLSTADDQSGYATFRYMLER